MKKYEEIYPVSRMCQVIGVSRSGFYAWKIAPESKRSIENTLILKQIKNIFEENKKRYGSPKITNELNKIGYHCGHNRIARLMRLNGIRAKVAKKYRPIGNVINKNDAIDNILNRRFFWDKPNQAWAIDITYIPTKKGWVYLCVILDLCSRYIVGWSVSCNMKKELVLDALIKSCKNRNPSKGLIIHSDQGSQFGSIAYKDLLKRHGFIQSMSRRGNCWDNACVENFFRLLKVEELNDHRFNCIDEVKYVVFCYIDHFYNRKRIHGYLGYKSPLDFENKISA
jgi:putative transposase